MLGDAFEPWLPTLQDITVRRSDLEVGAYYSQFGWDQLVVPDDCPHVAARMNDLETIFKERYAFRMIGQETLERWQIRLQNMFDSRVRVYERAYSLYEQYAQEMLDDMIEGESETITRNSTGTDNTTGSVSGTDSGSDSRDGSVVDTPDYVTNASDKYADKRTKESGTSSLTTSRTTTDNNTSTLNETITNTKTKTGQSLIDAVNAGFRKWTDIDQAFVGEFENNFLNIFWY